MKHVQHHACLHLLVFIAKHHPGDANTNAEGRQQQHADLRSFVQVRQVVLWDPAVIKMVHIIPCMVHKHGTHLGTTGKWALQYGVKAHPRTTHFHCLNTEHVVHITNRSE